MYEIQDMTGFQKGDQWRIKKNGVQVYDGGFKSTVRYAVTVLDFDLADFERSIQSIIYNGHNTLEFNSKRRLVATCYNAIQTTRKTG